MKYRTVDQSFSVQEDCDENVAQLLYRIGNWHKKPEIINTEKGKLNCWTQSHLNLILCHPFDVYLMPVFIIYYNLFYKMKHKEHIFE